MYVLLGYLCSEIGPGISNIAVSVSRLSVSWWFSIDWYSEMRLLMESIPEPMSTWESSFTQAAEALTGLVNASYDQNHLEILIQRKQIKEIVFSLFPANDRSKASTTSREWTEAGQVNMMPSYLSIGVLQEFGRRCNS